MERICKNCKWYCNAGAVCENAFCELDYETVSEENSCDMFDADNERNFIKTKKKGRYQ